MLSKLIAAIVSYKRETARKRFERRRNLGSRSELTFQKERRGKTEVICTSGRQEPFLQPMNFSGPIRAAPSSLLPWVPPLLRCHSSAIAGIAARSLKHPDLIHAPVSLTAALSSAAFNHYSLVFDRSRGWALQLPGKRPSDVSHQLLLPRSSQPLATDQRHFALSDICAKARPTSESRVTRPSRSRHPWRRNPSIEVGATYLKIHWLTSAHHCCSAPRSALPTPCLQIPAQRRSSSRRLVRHTCWKAEGWC